ncbi:MAG: dihydroorotate dehydrogenase electron transfer subunit [Dissulfurispiraceae bacterium]
MNKLFDAQVVDNVLVNGPFKILSVRPLTDILPPDSGQFFMLQTARTTDPLLKRPFSLFRYQNGILQFLYRIRGKGTACLSAVTAGDVIQLLGPLGNAYPAPEGDFIVVVGGIGIASIFILLEKYKQRAYFFCGARSCDELLMLDEAKALAKDVCITTDDGTLCRKGLITEPFKNFIESSSFMKNPIPIYSCGPSPMLKELAAIVHGKGITCYASLEEVMACGVGACLGCVTKTMEGYKRVCKEGPVFKIEDIVWG